MTADHRAGWQEQRDATGAQSMVDRQAGVRVDALDEPSVTALAQLSRREESFGDGLATDEDSGYQGAAAGHGDRVFDG
jgi:hypothetical protein